MEVKPSFEQESTTATCFSLDIERHHATKYYYLKTSEIGDPTVFQYFYNKNVKLYTVYGR